MANLNATIKPGGGCAMFSYGLGDCGDNSLVSFSSAASAPNTGITITNYDALGLLKVEMEGSDGFNEKNLTLTPYVGSQQCSDTITVNQPLCTCDIISSEFPGIPNSGATVGTIIGHISGECPTNVYSFVSSTNTLYCAVTASSSNPDIKNVYLTRAVAQNTNTGVTMHRLQVILNGSTTCQEFNVPQAGTLETCDCDGIKYMIRTLRTQFRADPAMPNMMFGSGHTYCGRLSIRSSSSPENQIINGLTTIQGPSTGDFQFWGGTNIHTGSISRSDGMIIDIYDNNGVLLKSCRDAVVVHQSAKPVSDCPCTQYTGTGTTETAEDTWDLYYGYGPYNTYYGGGGIDTEYESWYLLSNGDEIRNDIIEGESVVYTKLGFESASDTVVSGGNISNNDRIPAQPERNYKTGCTYYHIQYDPNIVNVGFDSSNPQIGVPGDVYINAQQANTFRLIEGAPMQKGGYTRIIITRVVEPVTAATGTTLYGESGVLLSSFECKLKRIIDVEFNDYADCNTIKTKFARTKYEKEIGVDHRGGWVGIPLALPTKFYYMTYGGQNYAKQCQLYIASTDCDGDSANFIVSASTQWDDESPYLQNHYISAYVKQNTTTDWHWCNYEIGLRLPDGTDCGVLYTCGVYQEEGPDCCSSTTYYAGCNQTGITMSQLNDYICSEYVTYSANTVTTIEGDGAISADNTTGFITLTPPTTTPTLHSIVVTPWVEAYSSSSGRGFQPIGCGTKVVYIRQNPCPPEQTCPPYCPPCGCPTRVTFTFSNSFVNHIASITNPHAGSTTTLVVGTASTANSCSSWKVELANTTYTTYSWSGNVLSITVKHNPDGRGQRYCANFGLVLTNSNACLEQWACIDVN